MSEKNQLILKWVRVGVILGFAGDLCYGLAIGLSLPRHLAHLAFWSFGPLLIAGAPGIYYFIRQHKNSIPLQIGTLFLILAGFSVTMMAVIQRAVFETFMSIKPESADAALYQAWEMGLESGNAVQLGLDVVWDIFIFASACLLAISMFKHPRLGKAISVSGICIGLAGLYLNFSTFPTPPGEAGSFDIGPLAGLWFLSVMIVIISNFKWLRNSLEESPAASPSPL